jgi:DNA-binding transcriptional LysR family regulator
MRSPPERVPPGAEVDLRLLRYFVAVAEERSFTRAAERLVMTQPALSRAVRVLESLIGEPLLVRGKAVPLPARQMRCLTLTVDLGRRGRAVRRRRRATRPRARRAHALGRARP